MEKRLLQIDAFTGEMQEGFVAYISPKRKNGFQRGWIAMNQIDALDALANANLGGQAYRVLLKLLAKVEFENFIVVSQSEMAKELGMKLPNFNRCLSDLAKEGVILRGPKVGRMGSLKLNPEYGWKGTAKNHIIALDEVRKARRTNEAHA